jgi:hypothetical protein
VAIYSSLADDDFLAGTENVGGRERAFFLAFEIGFEIGLKSCDVCGIAGDYDTVDFPLFHFSILKEVLD